MPLQVAYYSSEKVNKYIKSGESHYDSIILNLIRTAGYARPVFEHKIILDLVDSIAINYMRSRKRTSSIFFKYIYTIEAKRLLKYEKKMVQHAKCTLFVNKDEALYYSKFGNVEWLPNGVNSALLKKASIGRKKHFCFFGAMFYQPNIDAVKWFVANVLPLVNPEITFYIVGVNPSRSIRSLENERIKVTGFLDDPYELIQTGLCTVAPMQTGGGIQNKILESMALGQLTITNNLGARPIVGSVPMNHFLIANTPIEFASLINAIYENPTDFDHIKTNARDFILQQFSWKSYGDSLKAIIEA
jgi:glycosyltransferase involved in cell wall biosynthesis